MSTVKNAILKAKIEGVIYEIMVKTGTDNVYLSDGTTLTAKLASIASDIAGKAAASHPHAIADVTGLQDTLNTLATTEAMNSAISTAISDLISGAPETYDTLKEIADYIAAHQEVVDALNAAIGAKLSTADFNAFKDSLGTLAYKSKVAESDLSSELLAKVNASAEGTHSHANKALLDTYTQTEADLADAVAKKHNHANKSLLDTYTQTETDLADAVAKKHNHANKNVLDGISAENVTEWNSKSTIFYSASEPAGLAEGDLWVQLV